jgi:formylglycine-generating enzyme required for sulfatase activity
MQSNGKWEVSYRSGEAQRFIEPLGISNTHELEIIRIPAGTFMMGSPKNEKERSNNESPQHQVKISEFFMGRYPVTQAQWQAVTALPPVAITLKADPSNFKGNDRPVEQVSWREAVEFCQRLSKKTGKQYQLPTETQWEYACRAGTKTPFHFGETITTGLANYNGNYSYGKGTKGEYRQRTTPVSQFGIANNFGLCDLHGNVYEWCADSWHDNYEGAPTNGSVWKKEGDDSYKVIRGGSWFYYPWNCRSAYRLYLTSDSRIFNIGFRVVCAVRGSV